jgi:hypothetical protein
MVVVDFKGHVWTLHFVKYDKRAAWFYTSTQPPSELRNYGAIPVPVFTEWWT